MITLGANRFSRRLCQTSIGFERFMKDFYVPPFFVDCFQSGLITVEITASQIQDTSPKGRREASPKG